MNSLRCLRSGGGESFFFQFDTTGSSRMIRGNCCYFICRIFLQPTTNKSTSATRYINSPLPVETAHRSLAICRIPDESDKISALGVILLTQVQCFIRPLKQIMTVDSSRLRCDLSLAANTVEVVLLPRYEWRYLSCNRQMIFV